LNNPVAIADHQTGAVHFLYCVEYARCFYQRSDDDGETFTEPSDPITPYRGHQFEPCARKGHG
jgi:hypothetical protein